MEEDTFDSIDRLNTFEIVKKYGLLETEAFEDYLNFVYKNTDFPERNRAIAKKYIELAEAKDLQQSHVKQGVAEQIIESENLSIKSNRVREVINQKLIRIDTDELRTHRESILKTINLDMHSYLKSLESRN